MGSYLGAMLFNYLIYKSVSTPSDLYKMSIYAHDVEKNKSLSLEDLEGKNSSVIGSLYEKTANNKGKILTRNRDKRAAEAFFKKVIVDNMLPEKVVIDKSGVNKAALDSLNLQLALLFMMTGILMPILVRQIK